MNVWDVCFTAWFFTGLWFAFTHANGRQLAEIERPWQRRVTVVLCFPAYVGVWAVVRSVEYALFLVKDVPNVLNTARESWYGRPKEDKENA